jgi:hypothetical protein
MKIGKELGMKESHGEDLANHTGPESCRLAWSDPVPQCRHVKALLDTPC